MNKTIADVLLFLSVAVCLPVMAGYGISQLFIQQPGDLWANEDVIVEQGGQAEDLSLAEVVVQQNEVVTSGDLVLDSRKHIAEEVGMGDEALSLLDGQAAHALEAREGELLSVSRSSQNYPKRQQAKKVTVEKSNQVVTQSQYNDSSLISYADYSGVHIGRYSGGGGGSLSLSAVSSGGGGGGSGGAEVSVDKKNTSREAIGLSGQSFVLEPGLDKGFGFEVSRSDGLENSGDSKIEAANSSQGNVVTSSHVLGYEELPGSGDFSSGSISSGQTLEVDSVVDSSGSGDSGDLSSPSIAVEPQIAINPIVDDKGMVQVGGEDLDDEIVDGQSGNDSNDEDLNPEIEVVEQADEALGGQVVSLGGVDEKQGEILENDEGEVDTPVFARMYAWQAVEEESITSALLLVQNEAPAVALARAKKKWMNLRPEERCLMIAPWQKYQGPAYELPLDELVINGPDMREVGRWWRNILTTLVANDLAPARVAIDWETGMGYWAIKWTGPADQSQAFQVIWDNENALALLPEKISQYQPKDFNFLRNRKAVIAWEQYAAESRAAAIRKAYAEVLWDLVPSAQVTNYKDIIYSGQLLDKNGWPLTQALVGVESSPALYSSDVSKNVLQVQKIIDAGGEMPVPWISYPSYVGRDTWEETVRQLYALGVREFLYWNPAVEDKLDGDDAFASGVIEDLNHQAEIQAFAVFD